MADLTELRDIDQEAHKDSDSHFGRNQTYSGSSAGKIFTSTNQRELLMLEGTTEELDTKPYLRELPASYTAELVIFEWLEFLISKAGFSTTVDAITYYASIGWITESVSRLLLDYLTGFNEAVEEPSRLTIEDHTRSLVYIARLAALT